MADETEVDTVDFEREASALYEISKILKGLDRTTALQILASASLQLGHIKETQIFLDMLEKKR